MPPKAKAKSKAKAKATQKQKQKQTQVVNIKIGETAKPKRKYTRKPKGKPRTDDRPDGWLPPQNLTRSGQVFAPYQPIQAYPPTQVQPVPPVSFIAPRSAEAPELAPIEPDLTEPLPEPSDFNITEFLKQAKEMKKPDRMNYFYEGESEEPATFAPPPPAKPSFISTPPPKPPVEEQEEIYIVPKKKKETSNRVALLNEIKGIIGEMENEGIIGKRGNEKKKFLDSIFGEFGEYKGAVKEYNEFQLGVARENIRSLYDR